MSWNISEFVDSGSDDIKIRVNINPGYCVKKISEEIIHDLIFMVFASYREPVSSESCEEVTIFETGYKRVDGGGMDMVITLLYEEEESEPTSKAKVKRTQGKVIDVKSIRN